MKTKLSKGFTLAELLIVMAIIVVLAAVAIPTFGRQLETARETGDMEIIRSAYTEALSYAVLDAADGKLDGKNGGTEFPTSADTTAAVTTTVETTPTDAMKITHDYVVTLALMDTSAKIKQTGTGWQYVNKEILGAAVPNVDKTTTKVTFTFDLGADGNVRLHKDTPAGGTTEAPVAATSGIKVDLPTS